MELNNPETLRQVEACSDRYERALAENDVKVLDDRSLKNGNWILPLSGI